MMRDADSSSYESLKTNQSSQSSGYRSEIETESNNETDKIWVKRESFVHSSVPPESSRFKRTQSLDDDEFSFIGKVSDKSSLLVPPSGERIYDNPAEEYRPRTNTVPQASPKLRLAAASHRAQAGQKNFPKPVPIPRKNRPNLKISTTSTQQFEPIYDDPASSECERQLSENANIYVSEQLTADGNVITYVFKPSSDKKMIEREAAVQGQGPIYAQVKKQNIQQFM